MNVRTKVSSNHLARLALIGSISIGFGLYCLYDGFIGWPNQQKRAHEFIKFHEEQQTLIPKPDLKEIADHWNIYAAEKGWPTGNPGEPKKDYEISLQFVMAGVTGGIGLIFLTQLIMWRGRWIESNDTTITSNRGHQFKLDQIVELDKKKWDKKGIAKVKFQADGQNGRLTLDDCNYDRDTTQKILRHVEANIDHSMIVNGKPEPPLKAEKETSQPAEASG